MRETNASSSVHCPQCYLDNNIDTTTMYCHYHYLAHTRPWETLLLVIANQYHPNGYTVRDNCFHRYNWVWQYPEDGLADHVWPAAWP